MSEYQYYEFQTVDRRLTEKEMQVLRSFSTRARITPTGFSNEYHFGDFKGNEDAWMEKYFDGFLYLANWGTRELQIALPANVLAPETAREYCSNQTASIREKSGKLIFKFLREEEPTGEWADGNGYLSTLLQIRNELARGDLRSLYLGWLLSSQENEPETGNTEPPVPPNLGNLSAAQQCFADFFQIDRDLLAAAAKNSSPATREPVDRKMFSSWIEALPAKDKDEMLVRVAGGEEAQIRMELQARFDRQRSAGQTTAKATRRLRRELMAAAKMHQQERLQKEQQQAAIEKEHRQRRAAVAREKHLDSLKGQSENTWATVETLVATRQSKSYDLAVQHLVDLRDLAARDRDRSEFGNRFAILRDKHSSKKSFVDRLAKAGL